MSTLVWIVWLAFGMSLLALSGSATLFLTEAAFKRIVAPLVALAAGTLTGGALLHVLPGAVDVEVPGREGGRQQDRAHRDVHGRLGPPVGRRTPAVRRAARGRCPRDLMWHMLCL